MAKHYHVVRLELLEKLLWDSYEVDVGQWHAQDISGKEELVSHEVLHSNFSFRIPTSDEELRILIEPNLPWAEDHFLERVGGEPLNPAPSEAWWPYAVQGNSAHKEREVFSHTYPERYWPKFANEGGLIMGGRQVFVPHIGLRYLYGDLSDVIDLLFRTPLTRQAYLPVWFPEDTGATDGQRVPCSLGYHFILRRGKLDCTYFLRSCDFVRHFADDMYMTARLLQFVVGKLRELGVNVQVGDLIVQISSLHFFKGDRATMVKLMEDWKLDEF